MEADRFLATNGSPDGQEKNKLDGCDQFKRDLEDTGHHHKKAVALAFGSRYDMPLIRSRPYGAI